MHNEKPLIHTAKIPVQERGKARFNAILAATEELVLELGVDKISPHKIAKKANIPPASVYQYFPSLGTLFTTIAENHFVNAFKIISEAVEERNVRSWQDLAEILVDSAYTFYTRDKISEILFLGVYQTPGVREFTADRLTRLGVWYCDYFSLLYKKSSLEPLPEKLALCVDVIKGVYFRSLCLHKEIRPEFQEEARTFVMCYLRVFFDALEE